MKATFLVVFIYCGGGVTAAALRFLKVKDR
jgi:hypothetical protein